MYIGAGREYTVRTPALLQVRGESTAGGGGSSDNKDSDINNSVAHAQ